MRSFLHSIREECVCGSACAFGFSRLACDMNHRRRCEAASTTCLASSLRSPRPIVKSSDSIKAALVLRVVCVERGGGYLHFAKLSLNSVSDVPNG